MMADDEGGARALGAGEWTARMAAVPARRRDLNRVVMNYLLVEGYRDAAEHFAREAGETPAIDLAAVANRMKVGC